MPYIVEYLTVGCLPDTREKYSTLKEAKKAMRDVIDDTAKIITPLHFITLAELKKYGEITYAEIGIQHINISYYETQNYELIEVPVTDDMREYGYCSSIQDEYTLEQIQNLMDDEDITSAIFTTWDGDYDNLHVQFGYPSFREHKTMFRVDWR